MTADLSSASDGLSILAFTDERESRDIFAVQSDIVLSIIDKLRVKMKGGVPEVSAHQTANLEAHDLYLRGRFFANKPGPDGLLRAIDYYNRSVAKDTGYALAYAAIATAYVDLADGFLPPGEAYLKALAATNRALALDSTLAGAWSTAALVNEQYQWDWPRARRQFERAQALNPSDPYAYLDEAIYWLVMRRPDRVEDPMHKALERDPLSTFLNNFAVLVLEATGHVDSAIAQAHAALGDRERMYTWLTKGVDTHSGGAVALGMYESFRPFWNEPRYQALLRRVGVPERAAP